MSRLRLALLVAAWLTPAAVHADTGVPGLRLPLSVSGFRHITFPDIPPTAYLNDGPRLVATVNRSASFLLAAFDAPRPVNGLRFRWKSSGRPAVTDAAAESTKHGDDAVWRIGLLRSGPPPAIPFFAPGWMKAVRQHLPHPADRLMYFWADARHAAGAGWPSPYSGSIENRATVGTPAADGWTAATAVLPEPAPVSGVWIMADGDNTGAVFTAELADLELTGP